MGIYSSAILPVLERYRLLRRPSDCEQVLLLRRARRLPRDCSVCLPRRGSPWRGCWRHVLLRQAA